MSRSCNGKSSKVRSNSFERRKRKTNRNIVSSSFLQVHTVDQTVHPPPSIALLASVCLMAAGPLLEIEKSFTLFLGVFTHTHTSKTKFSRPKVLGNLSETTPQASPGCRRHWASMSERQIALEASPQIRTHWFLRLRGLSKPCSTTRTTGDKWYQHTSDSFPSN